MSYGQPAEWWRPVPATAAGTGPITARDSNVSASGVPFWALMAFTFILLLSPQTFFPWLVPLRLERVTAAVAIGAYLFEKFMRREPVMSMTREMWISVCLVGWAILTVPLSYWPGGSVSFLLEMYLKTLTIFWLLGHVVNTLPRLRRVAWVLSLMAVPLAITAVQNWLSGSLIPGIDQGIVKRIPGYEAPLTGHPNDLALMLNLILPLTVAILLVTRQAILRAVLLAIIVLNVAGVIVTFSRAGFLTLAATFILYFARLAKRPERRWALAALVVAIACAPLLPAGYLDRLGTISDIESDPTGSSQTRWAGMAAAINFVLAHPIVGAGVGMNILALNEAGGPAWMAVHNAYLQYAVELGVPGLVLFLLLFSASVKSARYAQRQAARHAGLRELFYLTSALEISLIAFAVGAFFGPVGYQYYFYYMAGLAIGAKAACESQANGKRQN